MSCNNLLNFMALIDSDEDFAAKVKATGDDIAKIISLAKERNCRITRGDIEHLVKISEGELNCYDFTAATQPDYCRCRMAGKLPFIHWQR